MYIKSQATYLDSGIAEQLQCGPDVLLEAVFDTGQTEQLQVPLEALYHGADICSPVLDRHLSLVVSVLKNHKVSAFNNYCLISRLYQDGYRLVTRAHMRHRKC